MTGQIQDRGEFFFRHFISVGDEQGLNIILSNGSIQRVFLVKDGRGNGNRPAWYILKTG